MGVFTSKQKDGLWASLGMSNLCANFQFRRSNVKVVGHQKRSRKWSSDACIT